VKIGLIFLSLVSLLFSCTMDCKSCHPNFNIELEQHQPLKICITCHTNDSLSTIDMGNAACGADCFSCHPVDKLNALNVKEHDAMNACVACHNNANFEKDKVLKLNDNLMLKNFLKEN